jgi:glycosyltransferase involved in cell wall biosynthesis
LLRLAFVLAKGWEFGVREVAIIRHNLFKISEPFIAAQAAELHRYTPVFLGRVRYGSAPPGAAALALSDTGPAWPLRAARQMLGRSPSPFLKLLGRHRPALLHAHFGIEGAHALPLARRLGVPLVTTFHGFDATLSTAALLSSPAWAYYPLFRRQLAARGALFLCASSFIRDRLLAMGFPPARTRLHYIGVDCRRITLRDSAEEKPIILHVARLVEVKGTTHLLRGFARLGHRQAELVIIGNGPLAKQLAAEAAALGIAARVRFLGALPQAEVLAWMRQAAMLVLPSVRTATGRIEGLGMVVLEAAASGVPVIGSNIGGIPEAIIDGETGFLVPERDEAALASRMALLLDDAAMRRRMGVAARALMERKFDLVAQTRALESLYDEVLATAATA